MRLSHWSRHSTLTPHSVDQSPEGRGDKPRGLWVSVDGEDDWPSWCHHEGFAEDRLVHRFRITLADDATILTLSDPEALRSFTKEYDLSKPEMPFWTMDWARLAKEYQGIIIAPYQWYARDFFKMTWYYTWDVASGCIWDSSAISSVVEIPTTRGVAA